MYFLNALSLLVQRKITFMAFAYCLKDRPIVVLGPDDSYIVDPMLSH